MAREQDSFDVVVAGAGIIGLASAYQIARRSALRVLVLDKGAAVGEGSTGASSSICRTRYSSDDMVCLARDGIEAYRHWAQFTGIETPRAALVPDGVLWLTGRDKTWAEREHQRLQPLGIRTAVLDDDELVRRFPGISPCSLSPDLETGEDHDCVGGSRHLLELDGGHVDPVGAASDLVDACRREGVDVRFGTAVEHVRADGGRVSGVVLADGRKINTPLVINALGPWAQGLFESLDLPMRWDMVPVRIQVLYRERPEEVAGHIPVTVDMAAGIYFRTQNLGQQLVVGSILEEDEREVVDCPDRFQTETDTEFEQYKLHLLHHRLPGLPYRGRVRGFCGLYTVNRDDVHPVVGPTPVEGFWVANGFSGHGFKLAPAIGSLIAQRLCGVRADYDTDVSQSFVAFDRAPIEVNTKSVLA
jgi:glycine/D-amino acid oxidase-like deaminating enzyme